MGSELNEIVERLSPRQLAGQLVVVGFAGQEAPAELKQALAAGERGGVVLFRRNLEGGSGGVAALQALNASLASASPSGLPPLVAIDEEGGRVARLSPPALVLPAMRRLADLGDLALIERVAAAVGRELSCLGVTMNFAPTRMPARAVSASSTVPSPKRKSGWSATAFSSIRIAPGVVMVSSMLVKPPAASADHPGPSASGASASSVTSAVST
jgi:hypothetical protein